MRKIFTLVLIVLALVSKANADPYYFRHYQTENGLSHNSVFCILQDKRGFMWFGTRDGLNRFDGYTFKTFRNDADNPGSIGSNFIYSLYQDKNGTMWVGSSKGLYRYNEKTESFSIVDFTANKGVGLLLQDKKGNIWFIEDQTLICYDLQHSTHTIFPQNKYFEASALSLDKDQNLWVSTFSGQLEKYDYNTGSFKGYDLFTHSGKATSHYISSIYETGQNSFLVGTSNQGIKLFDIATCTYKDLLTYNSDNTALYARAFIKSGADEYWVATESGVYIYNIRTGKFTTLKKNTSNPYAISDNAAYALCRDNEGGIWVGTYFGGVNYFNRQDNNFEKYFSDDSPNQLKGNIIREICQDNNHNLWIGTEDAGLNKFNPETNQFKNFTPGNGQNGLSYTNIHGLLVNGNELWIGTYEHGLDIMDLRTEKIIRHYSAGNGAGQLKSNFIVNIYRTRSGDILLGTALGLYRYNAKNDGFSLVAETGARDFVYGILEDHNGTIWIATLGSGVKYYNPTTGDKGSFTYNHNDSGSIGSNALTSIFEDSNNQLWFTTEDGGLNKYLPGTRSFKKYTVKNGFPSNFLFKVLEDNNHQLWITTTRGLVCFNPQSERLKVYTQANGLMSDQFNYNSAYKDEKGRLYFGCIKGLIRFNPSDFTNTYDLSKVYITGLQIDNKEVTAQSPESPLKESITSADKIILKPNQTSISIDFAAVSYASPQMTEYAYQLDGLDKGWTYLKTNRKVYFTKLPTGTYTFKVKAQNSSGVWNANETKLTIVVLPPFYASIWAYILYTLSAAAIVYYLIYRYHKNTEERNRRKIELMENEMAKEIYTAKIEFFTNITHEIRTPLTLIKAPLEKVAKSNDLNIIKNNVAIMQKSTDRLLNLTDQLLDFRKTEVKGFSLNFVKTNITYVVNTIYTSFIQVAEQKSLSYNLHLPDKQIYAYTDTEALYKIITNIISNAVKYADSVVEIYLNDVTQDSKNFTIEVVNDGHYISSAMKEKIFEPFFRLNETNKQSGTGIGLPLARSLATLHKGTLEFKPSADLLNTFVLSLPIHQDIEFELFSEPANEEDDDEEDLTTQNTLPVILLVEDNLDIQEFIYNELSDLYTVKKAPNGKAALDILNKQNIDLIISDIMMPVMDGLELCNHVKTNVDYSHIPIILLTAKNTLQAKIEGLEQGADAYIEKPFSTEHLMVQVANLLRNRKNIREYFANSPLAQIKSMANSKEDDRFLATLNDAINANLHKPDFDIEQLADCMNIGRRTLFRKIKGISNLSPNELINLARLKKAAELLAQKDYRIYEIADMVGFNSATVFTRVFHKQFGISPSEYMSSLTDANK